MGASAIEQIHLPNLPCASGIKPTKSQKSEEDWVFKLARSTYAQRHPGITANAAGYHRKRRWASPRTTPVSPQTLPGITMNTARLSPRSMDLDTEQLPRFLMHNNLRTVTIGDMNPDKAVVFQETVCYNTYKQNSFL